MILSGLFNNRHQQFDAMGKSRANVAHARSWIAAAFQRRALTFMTSLGSSSRYHGAKPSSLSILVFGNQSELS
jgi:hypothetical protein